MRWSAPLQGPPGIPNPAGHPRWVKEEQGVPVSLGEMPTEALPQSPSSLFHTPIVLLLFRFPHGAGMLSP